VGMGMGIAFASASVQIIGTAAATTTRSSVAVPLDGASDLEMQMQWLTSSSIKEYSTYSVVSGTVFGRSLQKKASTRYRLLTESE